MRIGVRELALIMKKILIKRCIDCPRMGRYFNNACHRAVTDVNHIPADCPLEDDLRESKETGWIPVSKRLPEDKTACLTCFKGSLVDFEMYLDGEFENGDDPNRTHWQHLPQPPQGEKGE